MKFHTKLAVLLGAFLLGAPFAFAQSSGNFVFIDQGQLATATNNIASNSSTLSLEAVINIGTGYTGTTTGAEVAAQYSLGSIVNHPFDSSGPVSLILTSYSDPGYSTAVGQCDYESSSSAGNYPIVSPFVDLTAIDQSDLPDGSSGCNLEPQYYVQIEYQWFWGQTNTYLGPAYVFGSGATTSLGTVVSNTFSNLWFPQFAVVGSGFQITPTASSSGLLLSGALTFCANAFASSSAPAIESDFGVGLCDVAGFLFIPNQSSVQSFQNETAGFDTHVPFSWFLGMQSILQGFYATTSSGGFIDLYIPFGTTTAPVGITGNLDIISTTTLSKYLPDPIRLTLMNLMAVAFYLLAFSYIYQDVKRIWNKPVT